MKIQNVEDFYQALVVSNYFNKDLQNKLQKIQNKSEYEVFIEEKILPIAKAMGYKFDVDEILDYEKEKLQTLSEEELNSITGGNGLTKGVTTAFISVLALTGGIMFLSSQKASAMYPSASISQPYAPYGTNIPQQTNTYNVKNDIIKKINASTSLDDLETMYDNSNQDILVLDGQAQEKVVEAYTAKREQLREASFNTRLQNGENIEALINEVSDSDLSPQFKEDFIKRAYSKATLSPSQSTVSSHYSALGTTWPNISPSAPPPSTNPTAIQPSSPYSATSQSTNPTATQSSSPYSAPRTSTYPYSATSPSTTTSAIPQSTIPQAPCLEPLQSSDDFVKLVAKKTQMSTAEQKLQETYTRSSVNDCSGNMFAAIDKVSPSSDWNTRSRVIPSTSNLESHLDLVAQSNIPGFGMQFTPLKFIPTLKNPSGSNIPLSATPPSATPSAPRTSTYPIADKFYSITSTSNSQVFLVKGVDALMLDTIPQVKPDDIIQVASQSNGLESPSAARIVPVKNYRYDLTQGPRASCISVLGVKARETQQISYCNTHYGQCKDVMRDLLKDCMASDGQRMLEKYPELVQNGYFQPWHIPKDNADVRILSDYLRNHSKDLQLITQLVRCERTGKNVLQVFNFAPSFQRERWDAPKKYDGKYYDICESVVVSQYKALARLAVMRSKLLGRNIGLHLTLVGQGAFENPPEVIRIALHEVLNEVNGNNVTVYLHGFKDADIGTWKFALS